MDPDPQLVRRAALPCAAEQCPLPQLQGCVVLGKARHRRHTLCFGLQVPVALAASGLSSQLPFRQPDFGMTTSPRAHPSSWRASLRSKGRTRGAQLLPCGPRTVRP